MFPIAWLSDVRSRLIITYEENAVQLILVWNRPSPGVSKEVVRLGDWVQLLTVLLILVASEGPVTNVKALLSSAAPPRLASVSTSEKASGVARSTGILCLHFWMQAVFRHKEVLWRGRGPPHQKTGISEAFGALIILALWKNYFRFRISSWLF